MAIAVGIAAEVNVAGSVNVAMAPQETERDWKRRWIELTSEWGVLKEPLTHTMSSSAINAAHHRLQSFFVQAYHLKDALIMDARSCLDKRAVESMINKDPRLTLLADLANLDKHYKLTRPPRSGDVPVVGPAIGVSAGSGSEWQLRVEIRHRGTIRDGVGVACDAMDAWKDTLNAAGLIGSSGQPT